MRQSLSYIFFFIYRSYFRYIWRVVCKRNALSKVFLDIFTVACNLGGFIILKVKTTINSRDYFWITVDWFCYFIVLCQSWSKKVSFEIEIMEVMFLGVYMQYGIMSSDCFKPLETTFSKQPLNAAYSKYLAIYRSLSMKYYLAPGSALHSAPYSAPYSKI